MINETDEMTTTTENKDNIQSIHDEDTKTSKQIIKVPADSSEEDIDIQEPIINVHQNITSTTVYSDRTTQEDACTLTNNITAHSFQQTEIADESAYIRVENLKKSFGDNHVLNGVSFSLNKGESFVIIGGSGTGKSVLIKSMLGLITPDKGDIYINNVSMSELSSSEHRETLKTFGMLFQGGALFDSMTIAENVAFGLVQGFGMNKIDARKVALEKLDAVDLSSRVADLYPAELSGGMQKRVALARAIATNPQVIFFDEPTTGLDPIVSGTINNLIIRCVHEIGACAITITHDLKSLRTIANRVGLLHKGKFVWEGNIQDIDQTGNPYVEQFIHGNPNGPFTDQQT